MEESFLKQIIVSLSERGVKYIIFGGVALVIHGVERMTLDLDISLELEEENVKKFLQVMEDFHMTPRAPISPYVLLDQEALDYIIKEKNAVAFTFLDKEKPYKQVDVLIHPELRYEKWIEKTVSISLFGHKVCLLSREAILEMKKNMENPRDKDLLDIKELEKSLGKKGDSYGKPAEYDGNKS